MRQSAYTSKKKLKNEVKKTNPKYAAEFDSIPEEMEEVYAVNTPINFRYTEGNTLQHILYMIFGAHTGWYGPFSCSKQEMGQLNSWFKENQHPGYGKECRGMI